MPMSTYTFRNADKNAYVKFRTLHWQIHLPKSYNGTFLADITLGLMLSSFSCCHSMKHR